MTKQIAIGLSCLSKKRLKLSLWHIIYDLFLLNLVINKNALTLFRKKLYQSITLETIASLNPNRALIFNDIPLKKLLARRGVYHTLFWTVICIYNTLYLGFLKDDYSEAFFEFAVKFPFYLGLVYCNIYYFIPNFLLKGRYIQYVLLLTASTFLAVAFIQTLINHLIYINYCPVGYRSDVLFDPKPTVKRMFDMVSIFGMTTGIKLTKDWIGNQEKIKDLEKQNLKNELEFLKSQIQPHFFFNTLNNLYSLTLKKSDLAPEVVVKLSDLMSYMLYESDSQETTLRKEVEHIKNYLDLESLRFGKRLHLDFQVLGEVEQKKIPPLLLLPFIENAFKHGTSHETGEIHLKIVLQVQAQRLLFEVVNPRFENQNPRKKHKGLGLKNVKRRLDLLYGKQYHLAIQPTAKEYVISLELPFEVGISKSK